MPVVSGIVKWLHGHSSQEVCPCNVSFARELPDGSPFAAREALAGKDGRTLARELLAMSQEEFSAMFKNSPMKRAKLRGLKRNAAVVLGNIGARDDVGRTSCGEGRGLLTRCPTADARFTGRVPFA